MHIKFSYIATLAGFIVLAAGCADNSGAPDAASSNKMKISKTCLETKCDIRLQNEVDSCTNCINACAYASYNCNVSSACSYSCADSHPCGEWENECAVEGFEATLPDNASPAVYDACMRWLTHVTSCGVETKVTSTTCEAFAAVERPEVAPNYDCSATLPCDALTDSAAQVQCSLPPSKFGDELCAAVGAKCALCTDEDRQALNEDGAWLRTDAMDAAFYCAGQATCDDVADCLAAWWTAVYGL